MGEQFSKLQGRAKHVVQGVLILQAVETAENGAFLRSMRFCEQMREVVEKCRFRFSGRLRLIWRWHLGSGEPVMDAFPETERGWVSKIIFERGEVHAAFLNALAVAVVAMVFKEGPLWCCRYQRRR